MNLADDLLLKELINQRLKELDWRAADLLRDAEERGYSINRSLFSKWRNDKKPALNDDSLIWIAERLGIKYHPPKFGDPVMRDGKIVYEIGKFNELEALKRLNILFKKK